MGGEEGIRNRWDREPKGCVFKIFEDTSEKEIIERNQKTASTTKRLCLKRQKKQREARKFLIFFFLYLKNNKKREEFSTSQPKKCCLGWGEKEALSFQKRGEESQLRSNQGQAAMAGEERVAQTRKPRLGRSAAFLFLPFPDFFQAYEAGATWAGRGPPPIAGCRIRPFPSTPGKANAEGTEGNLAWFPESVPSTSKCFHETSGPKPTVSPVDRCRRLRLKVCPKRSRNPAKGGAAFLAQDGRLVSLETGVGPQRVI